MNRRASIAWLVLVVLGCVTLFAGVFRVFVGTTRGQTVEAGALQGAMIGRDRIIDEIRQLLDLVSVLSLAGATAAIGTIAILRRRPGVALLAVGTVAASNISAHYLKHDLLHRPRFRVEDYGVRGGNTLPSGHTTVAMSVAVALVLVVPPAVRGITALLGAAYGAVTGVATLSAGWHRPSDAVAGCLLVGAWTAALSAVAVLVRPPPPPPRDRGEGPHSVTTAVLVSGSGLLLAVGAFALLLTARADSEDLSRLHLFVAYVGGAASIAGTALGVMAALLLVVHRVVPAGSFEEPAAAEPPGVAGRVLPFPSRAGRSPR